MRMRNPALQLSVQQILNTEWEPTCFTNMSSYHWRHMRPITPNAPVRGKRKGEAKRPVTFFQCWKFSTPHRTKEVHLSESSSNHRLSPKYNENKFQLREVKMLHILSFLSVLASEAFWGKGTPVTNLIWHTYFWYRTFFPAHAGHYLLYDIVPLW
jgi:hypothetical protein